MITIFFGVAFSGLAQEQITWTTLADVKFEEVFLEDLGYSVDKATFGKTVKDFQGKEVTISGFMIPLDALGTSYALSRNPNSTCFFCGGAGPETVIQLKLKPSAIKRYKMDEVLSFTGTLLLNDTNETEFTYVLLDAAP